MDQIKKVVFSKLCVRLFHVPLVRFVLLSFELWISDHGVDGTLPQACLIIVTHLFKQSLEHRWKVFAVAGGDQLWNDVQI